MVISSNTISVFFSFSNLTKELLPSSTQPLHALTVTLGPNPSQPIFLYNNILFLYASLGELSTARKVFHGMQTRNVVSFYTIISDYSTCGYVEEALIMFLDMRNCGFAPNQFTLGGLLLCDLLNLDEGVRLHALIVKNGLFSADVFVETALLGLYGRYGCLDEAVCVFEDMSKKSLVTCTLCESRESRNFIRLNLGQ